MPVSSRSLERIYLKIFKVVILSVMTLCLIAVLGALMVAGYHYPVRPAKKPGPAKPATAQQIVPDSFVADLAKREAASARASQKGRQREAKPMEVKAEPKKFIDEARQLEQSLQRYQQQINPKAKPVTEAEIETLRIGLQRVAEKPDAGRGPAYVKDAVRFTCSVLQNPAIIALGKEGKANNLFFETLISHIKQWDAEVERIKQQDASESRRISRETEIEQERIAAAKANATTALSAAGIVFGLFLALALYLIIASAENNLRGIDSTLRDLSPTVK